MNDTHIRISAYLKRSVAHGPGVRFVLWVQGCSLGCPECFSPHTHSAVGGKRMDVASLVALIRETEGIQGITISGGEPFEQAAALAGLTDQLRGTELTVMCYSGFRLSELRNKQCSDMDRLLANTDILIDGRFRRLESTITRWRGSNNQDIHWLTHAYDHIRTRNESEADVELLLGESELTTTGIWPKHFIENLHNALNGRKDDSTSI